MPRRFPPSDNKTYGTTSSLGNILKEQVISTTRIVRTRGDGGLWTQISRIQTSPQKPPFPCVCAAPIVWDTKIGSWSSPSRGSVCYPAWWYTTAYGRPRRSNSRFTTGNPFSGDNLHGDRIGRGLRALRAWTLLGRQGKKMSRKFDGCGIGHSMWEQQQ